MSDLHLGTKNIDVVERRLKSLIKTQLSTLEPDDRIDFIVTGDAVDSPSKVNNNEYMKLVLPGHKHIPFISEVDGINIISCGSSTGKVIH